MPRRLKGVAETNQIGVSFVRKKRLISLMPRSGVREAPPANARTGGSYRGRSSGSTGSATIVGAAGSAGAPGSGAGGSTAVGATPALRRRRSRASTPAPTATAAAGRATVRALMPTLRTSRG